MPHIAPLDKIISQILQFPRKGFRAAAARVLPRAHYNMPIEYTKINLKTKRIRDSNASPFQGKWRQTIPSLNETANLDVSVSVIPNSVAIKAVFRRRGGNIRPAADDAVVSQTCAVN